VTPRQWLDDTARACAIGVMLFVADAAATEAPVATRVTIERPSFGRASPSSVDARLMLSDLYSLDDETGQHLSFSEARAVLDASELFALPKLEAHVDGRWRHGWTEITRQRREIDRLYVQYGTRRTWSVGVGRQPVQPLLGAQVDGLVAGWEVVEGVETLVFGGLRPHPLSGDIDWRFRTVGLGYDARDDAASHAGGLAVDWYERGLDRIYLTERGYLRLADAWTLYGQAIVDFLSPKGILDDSHLIQAHNGSVIDGLDLTNALLRARYQARGLFDASVSAMYLHAIVPARWWWDWIASERAKRGFAADEIDNVGTRRGSVGADASLRLWRAIVPHLSLRADRRFTDRREGWEGRPGLKLLFGAWGFADLVYSYRQYYAETINHQLSATFGVDRPRSFGLEASGSVLQSRRRGERRAEMLYEAGGLVRVGLGFIQGALTDLDLIAQYQGFFDPEMAFHLFFARIAYRFRG
jgi:hypothetical protein